MPDPCPDTVNDNVCQESVADKDRAEHGGGDIKEAEVQKHKTEEYVLPMNRWVSGEELRKMMDHLGITREDLRPLSEIISFDNKVRLGVEGFSSRVRKQTLRKLFPSAGWTVTNFSLTSLRAVKTLTPSTEGSNSIVAPMSQPGQYTNTP